MPISESKKSKTGKVSLGKFSGTMCDFTYACDGFDKS